MPTDNRGTAAGASAGVLGSIAGSADHQGRISDVTTTGSFDDANSNKSPLAARSTSPPHKSRLYDAADAEIRTAKAMALAIQANPTLTPEQVRALVGAQDNQQLELIRDSPPKPKETMGSLLIPGRLASAFATSVKNLHVDVTNANVKTAATTTTLSASSVLRSNKTNSPLSALPVSPSSPRAKDRVKASLRGLTERKNLKKSAKLPPDEQQVRLTAIVWKRRSGLGKLSLHAWERRRVVLRGSIVEYYKTEKEEQRVDDPLGLLLDDGGKPDSESKNTKISWLETAAANLEKAKANVNSSLAMLKNPNDNLDPNAPRGVLDLVKERATVAAATGHSGAPTPFAISIKVRGETKWKFCHDSHSEQMEWLAALTDVVVMCSVDSYNTQLLLIADPTHVDTSVFGNTVHRPPEETDGTAAAGGHRLWELQEYAVSSRKVQVEDDEGESEVEESEVDESEVNEDDMIVGAIKSRNLINLELITPTASSASETLVAPAAEVNIGPTVTIRENDLYICVVIINVAMVYSHASSTTASNFWYIVTFANLGLWVLIAKEGKKKAVEQVPSQGIDTATATTPAKAPTPSAATVTRRTTKREAFSVAVPPSKPSQNTAVASTFKPNAGSTTVEIHNPTDVPEKDGHIFAAWRKPTPDLMIRSNGYMTNGKKKVPSPGTLYNVLCSDIFESQNRYPDMAPRVQLPTVTFDDDDQPKTWRAPDIFVISVSLPTDPPKLTKATDDGGGYTITIYMGMAQETRNILRRITADDYDPSKEPSNGDIQKSKINAVKLFEEWCRRAPNDSKFMSRFKLVPNAQNLKEIGMPAWITKYNGKPVLIKRPGQTGFLYQHPELSCIEFDISLHPFPYLAKQAICYMKENFFKKVLVTFGFVIEGRADDELPECLIGLMQLCYPDPLYAIQAEDVFAGTSVRSC